MDGCHHVLTYMCGCVRVTHCTWYVPVTGLGDSGHGYMPAGVSVWGGETTVVGVCLDP